MYTGRMMTYNIAALVLAAGLGTATAQAPPSPVRVSPGVVQANRIKNVVPQYPQEAKDARLQGQVRMEVVIDKEGKVARITVLSGLPVFTESAIAAVGQWEYRPTLLNGELVEIVTEVEINFTLAN